MDEQLKIKVKLLIETFDTFKKQYRWSIGDLSLRFITLVYVLSNKNFDKNEFDEMVKYIKKNSKRFSYYRGHQMFSTAALLIAKFDNPRQSFDDLLSYEEKMKDVGFKNSPYLSIASYALLLTCSAEDIQHRVRKAVELYKKMKENHFWLTGADDYPIAVLLSETDEKSDMLMYEIESNFDMLNREGFRKSNGLQFLSHLLTFLPGTAQTKAQRTRRIYDRLKQEKLHVSSTYYGILGHLSLLGEMSEEAVEQVIEVVRDLKSDKNFKWVNKDMNVLAATALVANQYIEKHSQGNELLEAGIGISIEAMIAAQTAALIAATSAATAASSAAASAGS
ncbi:DUF4003 family protein [Petroclostridium sp. X23]|uniref:DUF4003 family protein n=1 Tax=Petroclostridium sp. X23 TaxID=3045146 RepID=UPI0024ACFB3F|nr:DUF4003 family protein [Petroclostridium sp. X23]WHH58505.1 DUF4003 family protein [Petroclostridium sp. X23]